MPSQTGGKVGRVIKFGFLGLFVLAVAFAMYEDPRVVAVLGEMFKGWILYTIIGLPLGIAAVWAVDRFTRKRNDKET